MALAASCLSAKAGTNGLTVEVTPLAPNIGTALVPVYTVSYSGDKAALGQLLNAAYLITLKNDTSSNVTNAWFKVQSSIDNGPGPKFEFGDPEVLPQGCVKDTQVSPLGSGLICQYSSLQLDPGVSFTLVMHSPNPPQSGKDSNLKLSWTVQAGQGSADSNPSNIVKKDSPVTVLSVNSEAGLRSYVLKDDPFKVANGGSQTEVKPSQSVPVDLKQAVNGNSCSPMYKKCLQSTLKILDVNGLEIQFNTTAHPGYLVINLLRDKSTLKGFADISIAATQLHYTGADGSYTIPMCQETSLGSGVWTIPLYSRCVMPVSTDGSTGTFVDGAGHFHFRVLGNSNGVVDW
jgi:hypothetical protein